MQVSSLTELRVIDTILTSHETDIQCLDISPVSKNIVSYSHLVTKCERGIISRSHCIVVHGLADVGYLNGIDTKTSRVMDDLKKNNNAKQPAEQFLGWTEFWRCDEKLLAIQGFLNTISISPIGDVFILGGDQFLSLWTRDTNLAAHSYTMQLFMARNPPSDLVCSAIQ
jgi:hypothetical protein